jgi:hypothetical protein
VASVELILIGRSRCRCQRDRVTPEEAVERLTSQPTDRRECRPAEHDQRGGDRQDPARVAVRPTLHVSLHRALHVAPNVRGRVEIRQVIEELGQRHVCIRDGVSAERF